MGRRIVIVQGHPDPAGGHLCHGLADAYAAGATAAGHDVRRIDVARLEFPLLRTKADFDRGSPVPAIAECQADIAWAEHLIIVYPLWLGSMPALLKGFLEQTFRPGFAFDAGDTAKASWTRRLGGKSARIVVTMGMPALVYRWYYLAHSLKGLERNILGFCGIGPIRETLIGMVGAGGGGENLRHLRAMERIGRDGG